MLDGESKYLSLINFIQQSIEQDEDRIIKFIVSLQGKSEV